MTIKNKMKWNACIMIHLASRPTLTREIAIGQQTLRSGSSFALSGLYEL